MPTTEVPPRQLRKMAERIGIAEAVLSGQTVAGDEHKNVVDRRSAPGVRPQCSPDDRRKELARDKGVTLRPQPSAAVLRLLAAGQHPVIDRETVQPRPSGWELSLDMYGWQDIPGWSQEKVTERFLGNQHVSASEIHPTKESAEQFPWGLGSNRRRRVAPKGGR